MGGDRAALDSRGLISSRDPEEPLLQLADLVPDMAEALRRADGFAPSAVSQRGTRTYRPGIGPHSENAALGLALAQLKSIPRYSVVPLGQFEPYPRAPRQKCDLWFGRPLEWTIEVKMARFRGDNGRPDDTALKNLLSPYESDRSALGDCLKLACRSGLARRRARPTSPRRAAIERCSTTSRAARGTRR
jgi:hypothetical protein